MPNDPRVGGNHPPQPTGTVPAFTTVPAAGETVVGPARARTRAVNGPPSASAVTSAIGPATAQRTSRACCPAATRRAVAQAVAGPRSA
ncbi:hypothetical protein [Streptomyces sp. WZ-12]|uniref:hypothetical protein n=1 Tax=Streptomyces sp. WZ-12 TaxID=3030210 RepID=UPI0023817102|nr:hypothetical protein [Streptomyces sp. WZ-12]